VHDAGGGLVVEGHSFELVAAVQDAGYEAANDRYRNIVLSLQHSESITNKNKKNAIATEFFNKNKNQHLQTKTTPKTNLTRSRLFTVEFCVRACAIASAPSTPMWLLFCSTHITPNARKQLNTLCKLSTNKRRNRISPGTDPSSRNSA